MLTVFFPYNNNILVLFATKCGQKLNYIRFLRVAQQHILTGRIVTVTRATVAPFIMMMVSSLET